MFVREKGGGGLGRILSSFVRACVVRKLTLNCTSTLTRSRTCLCYSFGLLAAMCNVCGVGGVGGVCGVSGVDALDVLCGDNVFVVLVEVL